jgi:hypothetical protein
MLSHINYRLHIVLRERGWNNCFGTHYLPCILAVRSPLCSAKEVCLQNFPRPLRYPG